MEPEDNEVQMELFDEFDTPESDAVSALEDISDDDAEEDDLGAISELCNFVSEKFRKAEDKRRSDEYRWLMAYRNYRGIYGPDVQFREDEKSKAFVKVTKTKVLAGYGQICDVLFGSHKFPLTVEPTILPDGIQETAHINLDPNVSQSPDVKNALKQNTRAKAYRWKSDGTTVPVEMTTQPWLKEFIEEMGEENVIEGPGTTDKQITFHPAMKAAKKMEKKIHDQLDESNGNKHLRSAAFEGALYGHMVLKGPFLEEKEYPNWVQSEETGTMDYSPLVKIVPKMEFTSVWNFYPDPDADNQDQCTFNIERMKVSATELRKLKRRPFFRENVIEKLIEDGPNYTRKWWETALEDEENYVDIDRWEVLSYWGFVDADLIEEWGVDIPKGMEDAEEFNCNIWISGDQILRVVLNPFKPARIPYFSCPYEYNPHSYFGVGIAENMADTQSLMNGFMRMAVDNAVLSGNLIFEIDRSNLAPGTDTTVYPGKVFEREGGPPGQSIYGTSFPNVSKENMMMFDKSRMLADESTGLPSYSHGQQMEGQAGIGRTASGISMLMSAANGTIKTVVKNIDDHLLGPLGRAFFHFNMQFDPDPEIKGDLEVHARGTESLMANEVRSQRLMQFLGIAVSNPMTAPFAKIDYIIREIAKSLDLDPDKVANSLTDAGVQAELLKKMGPPQQDPAFLQAQQAADAQNKMQQAQAKGQGSARQDGSQPAQQGPGTPTPNTSVPGTNPAEQGPGSGGGMMGIGSVPTPGAPGFSGN